MNPAAILAGKFREANMEEILLLVLAGAGIVALATKTDVGRSVAKSIIKTGYGAVSVASSVGSSTLNSLQELMTESKTEFDAAQSSQAPAQQA
jgi:hypothetical protein